MSLDLNSLQNDYESVKDDENKGSFLQNFVRMPEGKGSVVLRLLPPAPSGMFGREKNPFFQWTRIHRVNEKSLHDPRVQKDGRWVGENPIGDYLRWLWKESEKSSPSEKERMQKLYREIKPIERYYYNVIVRSETDENGVTKENVGPKILSVGKTIHEIILRGIVGDKEMNQEPLGDVTDFKTGYDFKIVKTIKKSGERSFPNYDGSHFIDSPTPAGTPEECATWMENLHDLVALRVLKSPEELEHELMVHLGLKQDVASDFDPSKYQQPTTGVEHTPEVGNGGVSVGSVEETQTTAPVPPTVTATETESTPAPTTTDSSDEDEEVETDADFLEELRQIK